MLVSHRYKFIYLKSRKTAGTSTEAFLERYCLSPKAEEKHEHNHGHKHIESVHGIIGDRQQRGGKYPPHSEPNVVKRMVGKSDWDDYTKIVNIRNPYDVAVSYFLWTKQRGNLPSHTKFNQWMEREEALRALKSNLTFWNPRYNKYFYIRYESLNKDIDNLMSALNLPNYSDTLPTYKADLYKRKHYKEYFNNKTKAIISEAFSEYMERFNYIF